VTAFLARVALLRLGAGSSSSLLSSPLIGASAVASSAAAAAAAAAFLRFLAGFSSDGALSVALASSSPLGSTLALLLALRFGFVAFPFLPSSLVSVSTASVGAELAFF
jgi:hypothetical protein